MNLTASRCSSCLGGAGTGLAATAGALVALVAPLARALARGVRRGRGHVGRRCRGAVSPAEAQCRRDAAAVAAAGAIAPSAAISAARLSANWAMSLPLISGSSERPNWAGRP